MFERRKLDKTINYLKKKKKVLLLTTSNRWVGDKELPKSSILANEIKKALGKKAVLIDVSKLKIYPCEGNVSARKGNYCGEKKALLKDKKKNPSQCHRCWASINNKDDELWKISKELLDSNAVVLFGSVRWGQMNSIYQKLIERLTWLQNRFSTLGENNILEGKDAGVIIVGQNWRGKYVLGVQKRVLDFYGFNVPRVLSWNWQYTDNAYDESQESYMDAFPKFISDFKLSDNK